MALALAGASDETLRCSVNLAGDMLTTLNYIFGYSENRICCVRVSSALLHGCPIFSYRIPRRKAMSHSFFGRNNMNIRQKPAMRWLQQRHVNSHQNIDRSTSVKAHDIETITAQKKL